MNINTEIERNSRVPGAFKRDRIDRHRTSGKYALSNWNKKDGRTHPVVSALAERGITAFVADGIFFQLASGLGEDAGVLCYYPCYGAASHELERIARIFNVGVSEVPEVISWVRNTSYSL